MNCILCRQPPDGETMVAFTTKGPPVVKGHAHESCAQAARPRNVPTERKPKPQIPSAEQILEGRMMQVMGEQLTAYETRDNDTLALRFGRSPGVWLVIEPTEWLTVTVHE